MYGGKIMFESKYSKVLTVILVIVIIAIVGLLGFLAYDYYQNYIVSKDTAEFVENFQGEEEVAIKTLQMIHQILQTTQILLKTFKIAIQEVIQIKNVPIKDLEFLEQWKYQLQTLNIQFLKK